MLFAPHGTNSLEEQADYEMMEELSYHDSLKGEYGNDNLKNSGFDALCRTLAPVLFATPFRAIEPVQFLQRTPFAVGK